MVKELLTDAINKLSIDYPNHNITLKYIELHDLTHNATKNEMLRAILNGTNIDIISLDQIWLGEFGEKGLLTDLTNYTENANRKFAVMIEGSWMPSKWSNLTGQQINNIGFIPFFPEIDNKTKSSTLMGGWVISIPITSYNKNVAWKLIEHMLEPEILSPWLAKQGFLPTQISLGQGVTFYSDHLRKSIPFYDEMISMIPTGGSRPNIAEYQDIAEHIRQALEEVFYNIKEPRQALDDAAAKSAKVLGW